MPLAVQDCWVGGWGGHDGVKIRVLVPVGCGCEVVLCTLVLTLRSWA